MKRRTVQPLDSKRRGRCKPGPYTKYSKAPYQYSSEYREWNRKARVSASKAH